MPCTRNILIWRLIAKCEYGNGKSPNIYDSIILWASTDIRHFVGFNWILKSPWG